MYQFDSQQEMERSSSTDPMNAAQLQARTTPQRNMFQMNVMEYCKRIQQEFLYLERQFSTTRSEAVNLKEQKLGLEDRTLRMERDIERLSQMNSQLISLIPSILSYLPAEPQESFKRKLEKITQGRIVGLEEGIAREQSNHSKQSNPPPKLETAPNIVVPKREPVVTASIVVPPSDNQVMQSPIDIDTPRDDDEEDDEEEYDENDDHSSKRRRSNDMDRRFIKDAKNNRNNSPVYGTPKMIRHVNTFNHKEVVCSCLFNKQGDRVFTGGKGTIKVWDVKSGVKPLLELKFGHENYVRNMKLSNRGKYLIAAGETKNITLWNMEGAPSQLEQIPTNAPKCYGLCVSEQDENVFFTGHSNGTIGMWDINSHKQTRTFSNHSDYVSCLELSADGTKLVSAGLDHCLRVWDVVAGKEMTSYKFSHQIFAMAVCPHESWVCLGMENNMIEVINLANLKSKYQLEIHENSVLSLTYAHSGKWFISTGKDKMMTSWKSPFGGSIFTCREPNSILCSDISMDDTHILTGSGEKLASLYQLTY